jgi:cell division protein FtsB
MAKTLKELQEEQVILQNEINKLQGEVKDAHILKQSHIDDDIPIFSEEQQEKIIKLEQEIKFLKEELEKLNRCLLPDKPAKIAANKLKLKERFDNLWKKPKTITK